MNVEYIASIKYFDCMFYWSTTERDFCVDNLLFDLTEGRPGQNLLELFYYLQLYCIIDSFIHSIDSLDSYLNDIE